MPEEERRQNITQRECDLRHEPINVHMKDTKDSIRGLHKKMNATGLLLVAALITALVDVLVRR